MSARQRIDQQPGFVLHSYPYRETSLIVEVFSRDHGRIGLVAKGARRPMSQLRGVLMAFQPLLIDWSGGGEMKTLVRAEWQGGQPLLGGQALLCAYYLNELLMRLLPREDPHPVLFRAYGDALRALAAGEGQEVILRRFELALLQELGYGLQLDSDADGAPVRPELRYAYIIERGAVPLDEYGIDDPSVVAGRVLLDMARGDFREPETLAGAKALMRRLIQHYLGGQVLQSRRVFTELFAFPGDPS
ncbi:DNA repair protein RecO [Zoogloea ramigera]|jgi:DNA repair protein RecO (recombination protein O)|uniref:DNA repair protein RecO n=1 Tax=Zoogloea ramigera TaxID=350 RepID=A0A4Y4CS12_ZOORA|nr:DNA repair protein RecO [Zoogloea ramigera]GEC95096.1 DNA repair protein RecO [Zoogloea ramigera]